MTQAITRPQDWWKGLPGRDENRRYTRAEAIRYVADFACRRIEKRWCERQMQELLDRAGGNISRELELMPKNGIGERLGNCGYGGPGIPSISCFGSVPRNPIQFKNAATEWDAEPDYIITWREVLECLAGKLVGEQLALFAEGAA